MFVCLLNHFIIAHIPKHLVRLALKTICIFEYNLSKFQETYIWHQETPNRLMPIFPITFTPARPILRIFSIWRPSWISRWPPSLKFSQISNKNGQITLTQSILVLHNIYEHQLLDIIVFVFLNCFSLFNMGTRPDIIFSCKSAYLQRNYTENKLLTCFNNLQIVIMCK